MFANIDWVALFTPDKSPVEIIVRGSLVYIAAFALLRLLKREAGTLSITDLIVIVFLADAAQNAMGDDYHSIPDGVLLMAVIVLWAYLVDRLGYYHPRFERLLKSPPLPLIVDGKMIRANMRQEFITTDELMGQLRLQGIEDVTRVKRAYIESDGRISVIEKEEHRHSPPDKESG